MRFHRTKSGILVPAGRSGVVRRNRPSGVADAYTGPLDNGIKFPLLGDWTDLANPVADPGALYHFQDTSGNLLDETASSLDLSITLNGGTATYESALGGSFTRVGFKFAEVAAACRAHNGSANFDIAADESLASLTYVRIHAIPAFNAMISYLGPGSPTFYSRVTITTGFLRSRIDDTSQDGSVDHAIDALFPLLLTINRVSGFTGLLTDLESIEETTDPGAINSQDFIGFGQRAAESGCPEMTGGLMSAWLDEPLDEILLEDLGWTLAY